MLIYTLMQTLLGIMPFEMAICINLLFDIVGRCTLEKECCQLSTCEAHEDPDEGSPSAIHRRL